MKKNTEAMVLSIKYIFTIIFLICLNNTVLSAETVKISAVNYPPFTSEKPYENIGYGVLADLVCVMFEKASYQPDIIYLPHQRYTSVFAKGRYPFIISTVKTLYAAGLKPGQFESISLGYFNAHLFYFKSHLKKKLLYIKYEDLTDYSVCLIRQSYIKEALEKAGVRVQITNSPNSCMEMLVRNRVDIWGSFDLTAYFLLKEKYPEIIDDFTYATPPQNSIGVRGELVLSYLASNTSAARKAVYLNRAFSTMKKDGTFMEIMKRYWGETVPMNVLPADMQ